MVVYVDFFRQTIRIRTIYMIRGFGKRVSPCKRKGKPRRQRKVYFFRASVAIDSVWVKEMEMEMEF